jgi:ribonuclease HI
MIIYTDGSCIRDGEAKKVYCGYGIVIPDLNIKLSEPLNDSKLTNNRAEMRAILHAIELVSEEHKAIKRLCIFTDSQYCKYIFQGTGERYEKDGFMKSGEEVPNKDMIITALSYMRKYNIVILKVRAHTDGTDVHSTYNDFADKLANEGAMKMKMGTKYKPNNNLIQNMMVKPEQSVKHPFEKQEIIKSSTPEVEFVKSGDRYNDKNDWREKEKEQFKNKTKLNQIFNVFTDEEEPVNDVKEVKEVTNKVGEKKKVIKEKSNIFNVFTDEEEPIKEVKEKKIVKEKSNIFNVFTDEDITPTPIKKEEKREVTVKIINNKVNKFAETRLSDFM